MKRRPLLLTLLTIGYRAGCRMEAGALRFIALVLASAALTTAAACLPVVHAMYAERAARDVARAPVSHPEGATTQALLEWRMVFDTVQGRQFTVVLITPRAPDAPLPPGLSRWPGPGEAVLSPALIAAGEAEGILDRYGRVVGRIDPSGLAVPDEMFAYVRPMDGLQPGDSMQVDGFGVKGQAPLGENLMIRPEWMLHLLLVLLFVLPASILLFVAARTGAHARDRRVALATTLGALRRHRAAITLGEAGPPVIVGALLALAAVVATASVDLRVPVFGYLTTAEVVRSWLAVVLGSWLVGVLATLLVIVWMDGVSVSTGKRTRPLGGRRPPIRTAVLCPVMLLLAVRGPELFPLGSPIRMLVNYVGIAGTLLTLPAVIGIGAAIIGAQLARLGRRLTLTGTMISGRWMAARPGVVARVAAGIVAVIGLLIQAQVWFGFLGGPVVEARALHARIGDSVQVIRTADQADQSRMSAFFGSLPDTAQPLRLAINANDGSMHIVGPCPAFSSFRLACPETPQPLTDRGADPRLAALINWYGHGLRSVTMQVGDPAVAPPNPDDRSVLVLVSRDASDLPTPQIVQAAYRTLAGGATALPIGGEWLVGAAVNADQGRWLILLGAVALLILTTACGISGLTEFMRWSRTLAPVTVLAGNRRVFISAAAWSVFTPVVLAGLIGTGIGLWLALPMVRQGYSQFSPPLVWTCLAGVAALGVVLWLWAVKVAAQQSRSWLPGAD